MKLATIRGHLTATVKHPSLHGQRLLIAQPVNADGEAEGAPQVVIDPLGCAHGQRVLISSDGAEARKIVADSHSPARWFVAGIVDAERGAA